MATNASAATPNYGLSQWAEGDRIRREDFNHDNAAIDTALYAQAAQTEAAIHAVEEGVSLVRLFSQTLAADAAEVNIDLSVIDMSRFAALELKLCNLRGSASSSAALSMTINGNTASGDYFYGTSSGGANTKLALGSLYDGSLAGVWVDMLDSANYVLCYSKGVSGYISSGSLSYWNSPQSWAKGSIAGIQSMKVSVASGVIRAGACLVLYGWKK